MKRLTRKSNTSDMVWFIDRENNNHELEPCEMDSHHSGVAIRKLAEYEELGYTAEELKLSFNPPSVLYIIGEEYDETVIHPIYPVDGEQIEFSNGNVYWNCRDIFDDYIELPLEGLHTEYFLTYEEGYNYLSNSLVKE